MRRIIALISCATLLLSACSPGLIAVPRFHGPPVQAQLVLSAYDTLMNDYVLPLDPSALALAAATGMQDAVSQGNSAAAAAFTYLPFWGTQKEVRSELSQQFALTARQFPQVDPTVIAYTAITAMAQSINDCHTNFFTPSEYQQQQAEIQGKVQFGGIGASLKDRPGATPLVGEVFAGLPAAQAGLHPGDAIVRVDGKDIQGLSASTVVTLIRGPVGTVVSLDIQRTGAGNLHFSITRRDVTPPALNAGTVTDSAGNEIGYAHIYSFTPEMPQELQQVLQQFQQRQAKLWIVDLRDNSGGTVQSLLEAVSLFVPQGPVAHFQNRAGHTDTINASGNAVAAPHRLVVLINNGSASASEIFAAAVQEQKQGSIVGTRSAGCVAVGEVHALADGSAIEYAADRVETPVQNRVLNGAGVTPDVTVAMSLADLAAGRDPQLAGAEAVLDGRLTPPSAATTPQAPAGAASPPKLLPQPSVPSGSSR